MGRRSHQGTYTSGPLLATAAAAEEAPHHRSHHRRHHHGHTPTAAAMQVRGPKPQEVMYYETEGEEEGNFEFDAAVSHFSSVLIVDSLQTLPRAHS